MVNILICCTGSVATIKIPELVDRFRSHPNTVVRLVVSQHSRHFLPDLSELGVLGESVLTDQEEWDSWTDRGDPVLHIELRKWADICVVAPLSANTLAKLAMGMADNLLTSTLRAWDFSKPICVAPAMNTCMWDHPVTRPQVELVESWGYTVIPPVVKTLVCGDTGTGAMASVETVIDTVLGLVKT